ncbi:MAG TPA: glycoside hydrolase family 16 protein, partial [Bacteroidia bacterium]|nr:glycoside hydrolase family 16 protein [Bacteroidia bacterium]
NAFVSNGNLLIISRKESYSGSNYTSARMKTQGLQSWTYGKVEANIKIQPGKGMWPAFWMLGTDIPQSGWPTCGEIDIMEHINTDSTIEGTMHWENNGAAQYGGNTHFNESGYHLYSVEWSTSSIKWFLDGVKYWEGNIANGINGTTAFQKPFFILLNQAVGGSWPGSPDANTLFPDTMFVDYVRVYQDLSTSLPDHPAGVPKLSLLPDNHSGALRLSLEGFEPGASVLELSDLLGRTVLRQSVFLSGDGHAEAIVSFDSPISGAYVISIRNPRQACHLKFIKSQP